MLPGAKTKLKTIVTVGRELQGTCLRKIRVCFFSHYKVSIVEPVLYFTSLKSMLRPARFELHSVVLICTKKSRHTILLSKKPKIFEKQISIRKYL